MGQKAAGHVDVAAGEGEGVDHGRVEHGEGPVELGELGAQGELAAQVLYEGRELLVPVDPELRKDARMGLEAELLDAEVAGGVHGGHGVIVDSGQEAVSTAQRSMMAFMRSMVAFSTRPSSAISTRSRSSV